MANDETRRDAEEFIAFHDFIIEDDREEIAQARPQSVRTGNKQSNSKKKKQKALLRSLIWIVSIFVISIGIAVMGLISVFDYLGIGPGRGNDCAIEIPAGSSTRVIAEKLKECGAIKSKWLFIGYSRLKGYGAQYKYGVYTFSDEIGYDGIADMLVSQGAEAKSVRVTIPEGSSVDDIMDLLETNGVCKKEDFREAIQTAKYTYDFVDDIPDQSVYWRLEGYLYPDTYDFYCYDSKECAKLAVRKMLSRLDEQYTSEMQKQAEALGYSMHQILSLASVIELEAGGASYEDKQGVAAVFYNRINDWGEGAYLQSNPTRDYPHGSGRYNTYETPGIPVGPLCSPSLGSIQAALTPAESYMGKGYYYFITDKNMNFYYNQTLDAHVNTQNRLIREGKYYAN